MMTRLPVIAAVILIGLDEPVTDTDQIAIKTSLVHFAKREMACEFKEEDIVETQRLGKQVACASFGSQQCLRL